eukprot:CAMPEP_0170481016 /NCGR_PEP_ID=MMETSP0208-20121228/1623_1 /TAXON_ID=197538 /ORGANISM="Strombidium inclinatum, Strain S3" /LENGTH=236 /DNA_ID=CAMNT_0010753645 /DNA_START=1 /DNA_END=708 /DNA_ORIENTATION=-
MNSCLGGSALGLGDVGSRFPGQLDGVRVAVDSLSLGVQTLDDVSVLEHPLAGALGLVVIEIAREEGAIGVLPLALYDLASLERTHEFLLSLFKYVSSLSVLLSILPLTRVNIAVYVLHDAFSVLLTLLPVAMVDSEARDSFLADAVLQIIIPLAFVPGLGNLLGVVSSGLRRMVFVFSVFALANAVREGAVVDVAIGVGGGTVSSVSLGGLLSLASSGYKSVFLDAFSLFCHILIF